MWKRVEGKKIKESVSSNQQHWRRERHQIDQKWAGTMLEKKKEGLLAIKLNCLGHIWQEKCELEAANIAQIYFYLLEISQPQMWRRNEISNRLSIMTGSGLTTTRTKMQNHSRYWNKINVGTGVKDADGLRSEWWLGELITVGLGSWGSGWHSEQ